MSLALNQESTPDPSACELMVPLSCPEVTANSPALIVQAQTEIDDELLAHEEIMRALRTRRNSFSPVSSIPPEILGAIFVHHAHQTQLLHAPDSPAVLSWLIVGHVCHHWRDVALGTPKLWATPYLKSSNGTEEMLMRSKMAPLILKTGTQYRMDCVQKALLHVERLQEVSLLFFNGDTTHPCIAEFLNKLSSYSAPNLQSLSLDGWSVQTPRIAVPISFLAPDLRKLQIKHCDLSWTSSVLSGLTILDIKGLSPECLPTIDQLVSALRRMPALHTLALADALPTLPAETNSLSDAPRAMIVRLPHLKRLRLVAEMSEVANMLTHVELPESTPLEIQLGCRVSSPQDSNHQWNMSNSIIYHFLESHFRATPAKSGRVPRSMRLSIGGDCIRLQCSTDRNPSSWRSELGMVLLNMEWMAECPVFLNFNCSRETGMEILSNLQRFVPLDNLEALYIEGFCQWDGFWNDVFGRNAARNIAYIQLQGNTPVLKDLLTSLRSQNQRPILGGHSRARMGPILFPALSHLVFRDLHRIRSSVRDLRDVVIDRLNEVGG